MSSRVARNACTSSAATSVGFGRPESNPELGGAGSIEVYVLIHGSRKIGRREEPERTYGVSPSSFALLDSA